MKHYLFDLDDCIIFHQNKIKYHWISENKELTYYLKKCKAKKNHDFWTPETDSAGKNRVLTWFRNCLNRFQSRFFKIRFLG